MNNNPFEPVTTDPAIDPPQTDDAADNFTADDDTGTADLDSPAKAPLSIDGISPKYGADASGDDSIDGDNNVVIKTGAASSDEILTDDHAGDFLDNMANDTPTPEATDEPAVEEPAEGETPILPAPAEPEKPAKRVTISLLTIIFFILAVAGIGGTVFFWLENNKNVDAREKAEAKVLELEDKLSTSATAENTTAGQYDGLNDKIGNLEGKNEESQKTIDDYKKKNEELTKEVEKLTGENKTLDNKAKNISDLTTKLDVLLSNCKITTTSGISPCTVIVP